MKKTNYQKCRSYELRPSHLFFVRSHTFNKRNCFLQWEVHPKSIIFLAQSPKLEKNCHPKKKTRHYQKKTRKTHIQKNAAQISTSFSTIQHGFRSFSPLKINIGCLMSIRFLDFPSSRRFSHFSRIPRRNPFEKKSPVILKYTYYIYTPRSFNSEFAPEKKVGIFKSRRSGFRLGFSVGGFRGEMLLNFGTGYMVEKNKKILANLGDFEHRITFCQKNLGPVPGPGKPD